MANFTTKQIYDLNNSMTAAQNVLLGSLLGGIGKYVVTGADDSASAVSISTSSGSIAGWLVQIMRSGSIVTADAKVLGTGTSTLIVQNGASTYNMAAGDVINYFVF